ncbi:MAG: S8 family serine peptidase [Chitinophagales bacterium]|nr:S8 family serine peptidase [Chitinophagales bacterium]
MKYSFKYGGKDGKTIQLVESPDKLVVRIKNNRSLEGIQVSKRSRDLLSQTTQVAAFPEAGVSVLQVQAETKQEALEQRDATRTALKQEDDIRFAGRVLQNAENGALMLYTENFFLKFKEDTPEKACLALIEAHHLQVKMKLPFAANAWFVQAPEGTGLAVFAIAEALLSEAIVEYCHPELVQERADKVINPVQWHLKKTQIGKKTIDAHVNIEAAWAYTRGKGITIAVIDKGIDIDHPEFTGRIVFPYNANEHNDNPRPQFEGETHGTPCAGLACAAGREGGASGTAPEANLMPVRLYAGIGSMLEALAFTWAADQGADVISCSWGPPDGRWYDGADPGHTQFTPMPDSTRLALEHALKNGRKGKGCVVFFAAGNGNEDIAYDAYASHPGVIAVAACNDRGKRSVFSDYGEAVWLSFPGGDYGFADYKHPAPRVKGLHTTDHRGASGETAGDYNNNFIGTSAACPGAAGVAALMLALNPALSATEIKALLRHACTAIDPAKGQYDASGHSKYYGYGRVDAGRAAELALLQRNVPAAAVQVAGNLRFQHAGEIPLATKGLPTQSALERRGLQGFRLWLSPAAPGLKLRYKVNTSGNILQLNEAEGEYVGASGASKRALGFAAWLEGAPASGFVLRYGARFKGSPLWRYAADGAWLGSAGSTGPNIEAMCICLLPKA